MNAGRFATALVCSARLRFSAGIRHDPVAHRDTRPMTARDGPRGSADRATRALFMSYSLQSAGCASVGSYRRGRDPVGVAKALGAGLGPLDGRRAHECCDVPARGRAGEGPQRRRGASRAALRAAQPLHERELARELLGDRDRAPVFFSAFERAETQLGGGEVNVARALLAGQVFPPARVDQGEACLGHGANDTLRLSVVPIRADSRGAEAPSQARFGALEALGAVENETLCLLIGIEGHLSVPPLPHHRAYGSVPRRFAQIKPQQGCRVWGGRASRNGGCVGPAGPPRVGPCASTPSASRRRWLPGTLRVRGGGVP